MQIKTKILERINQVSKADWNGLLPDTTSPDYHPFTDWNFLDALEQSGSVGSGTGWQPAHMWSMDGQGNPLACAPLYVKSHSMGEYVFDQGWADAATHAGLPYYPKLQCAIPFTPVTGPRLIAPTQLARNDLAKSMIKICQDNQMSGVHVTFLESELAPQFEALGFLIRTDRQFHFVNRGYRDFAEFLAGLTSRKRKKIKAERRKVGEQVQVKHVRGDDIKAEHWDAFYRFYLGTGARKWGRPYLTRDFFTHVHAAMGDQILLILAYQDGAIIAGALNFIGGDALYGRHWGACVHVPFLHFELCYYQAIEAAITLGLGRVEAGAQGEHKLARGYEPVPTYSAHYLAHPDLRAAIAQFLDHERRAVQQHIDVLNTYSPFRKG